jgi:hypothetical protein
MKSEMNISLINFRYFIRENPSFPRHPRAALFSGLAGFVPEIPN